MAEFLGVRYRQIRREFYDFFTNDPPRIELPEDNTLVLERCRCDKYYRLTSIGPHEIGVQEFELHVEYNVLIEDGIMVTTVVDMFSNILGMTMKIVKIENEYEYMLIYGFSKDCLDIIYTMDGVPIGKKVYKVENN